MMEVASRASQARVIGLCSLVTVVQLWLIADWIEPVRNTQVAETDMRREPVPDTKSSPEKNDGAAPASPPPVAAASDESKTIRIFASVRAERIRPLLKPQFSTTVGSRIPRSVRLYPLTTDMTKLLPEFIGHQFILTDEQILIIEPRQKKIVAVLEDDASQ